MKPWTEAHRREGIATVLETIARRVRSGVPVGDATDKLDEVIEAAGYETAWNPVGSALRYDLGMTVKEIRRLARRVRGLAEGRLVREEVWRWYDDEAPVAPMVFDGPEAERECREWCEIHGGSPVRVRRIRMEDES